MGIDRHELEHRNWRSASIKQTAQDADIAPADVTIVPDDVEAIAAKPSRKPAKKAKRDA